MQMDLFLCFFFVKLFLIQDLLSNSTTFTTVIIVAGWYREQKRFGQKCVHPSPNVPKGKQGSDGMLRTQDARGTSEEEKSRYSSRRKLNHLTPLFRKPERCRRFQRNEQCHAFHKYASSPPRHQPRKVAVSKKAGGDPLH